ncbi:MAG: SprT family zinc-dependent metalloprotease [Lachnospiraceae bacterium]|nr:SprT family zinc-dependent metalloprotease [Lachnospiraceae bacterium]
MNATIHGTEILYQLQYSKRQSMELEITPEGHVFVKAPVGVKEYEVLAFLKKNAKVLVKNQERLENREYVSSEKVYEEEENYLLLGRVCKLTDLLNPIPESKEAIQDALKKAYTKQTRKIIQNRVAYYETIIKVKCKSITIVNSPASWGTCNSRKELTFNYKLSMADLSAIDYVVIHELCHIMHLNHDRSFWRDVGKYDKDYKAHQEYLRRFGGVMTI